MVKYVAKDTEPLFTAAERVDAALAKLMVGRTFTDEQHAWVTRIREYLIANLSSHAGRRHTSVHRFLAQHHPEILSEFHKIVESKKLLDSMAEP